MKALSRKVRIHVLNMVMYAQSSHIGAAYSIVEILVTLYLKILRVDPKNPKKPDRDKFILSKAHGSTALYAILAEVGFFPLEYLEKYYVDNGILPGHLDKEAAPGIEYSLGSLGHGLSVGVGMAIANKQTGNPGRIFVLLSDGECNEGSVWEAIMLASHLKLTNLTAIIDYNKIQSFGRTNEVINQEPISDRWHAFGWEVIQVDGHNHQDLLKAFELPQTKPKVIIAHTVKGKGVSFMEDTLDWHYKSPNKEQYEQALHELEGLD
jgi:transketolase